MKRTVLLLSAMATGIAIQAHDFTTLSGNQFLYYSVTDTVKNEVCVTYPGKAANASTAKTYTGMVSIPQTVKHDGRTYSVTAIGAKAFCNADSMTGIIMEGGIRSIGDYAFDGCTSLESIIFPGNPVEFGEGVFFRCTAISRITFGSDWTSVNLKSFRWSYSLTEISIPAKMRQIQNMKSLSHLKSITVDSNNPYYRSADGILYSNDGTVLYGAPRAMEGKITISEGTERIYPGALADCYDITEIVFPATLKNMSYTELANLEKLTSVSFNSAEPICTATLDGNLVFALKLTPEATVYVPKKAVRTYRSSIVSQAGEYAELEANVPSNGNAAAIMVPKVVKDGELAKDEAVKGDKKLGTDK